MWSLLWLATYWAQPFLWFLDPHVPPQLVKVIQHPRNSYFVLPFHAEVLLLLGKMMDSSFPFWDAWLLLVPSGQIGMVLIFSLKSPRICLKNTESEGQSISEERGGCAEWIWGAVRAASGYFPFRILSSACGFTAIEFWWASHSRAQVARDKHGFVLTFLQM